MANPKGNPQNFKIPRKGDPSPNPKGRPKDIFGPEIKKLSTAELEEVVNLIVKGNVDQLRAIAKDPHASVIKTMFAAACVKIISKGDMAALDKLLDRLVGKVENKIRHSGLPAAPAPLVSASELRELFKKTEEEV